MMSKIFLLFLIFLSTTANSAEFPNSADSKQPQQKNLEDEFAKGFSSDQGMKESDDHKVNEDRLKIGGSIMGELQFYQIDNTSVKDILLNPNTLELYLDSRLKNDIRAFFKGRLINDSSVDESVLSPLTGLKQTQNTSVIDEMNLRFQTSKRVFWTVGKQKLKWGASKFWNPTDFINLQRRDFLRTDDQRAGISMLKAHVPVGDSNLYAIAVNEKSQQTGQVGAAARFEIPFEAGEWTFSSYSRQTQKTKIGTDLSFAVKDVDLYVEGSQNDTGDNKSVSGGAVYEFKYSEEDTASVGLESFWQDSGTSDKTTYSGLISAGKWVPFYVGKSYSSASLVMIHPGSWNDSTYSLYVIRNNMDESQYYRLSWIYTGLHDATWNLSVGTRTGTRDSEMRVAGLGTDATLQVKVNF